MKRTDIAALRGYFDKYVHHLRMKGNAPYYFNDTDWTAFILLDFRVRIGHEQCYEMRRRAGEQPLDLCWARTSQSGKDVGIYLALEVELGGTEAQHDKDFDKLVKVRAPAKAFLCQCTRETSKQEALRLIGRIGTVPVSGAEEAYLIITHRNLGKEGDVKNEEVRRFIADQAGKLVWESRVAKFQWHPDNKKASRFQLDHNVTNC